MFITSIITNISTCVVDISISIIINIIIITIIMNHHASSSCISRISSIRGIGKSGRRSDTMRPEASWCWFCWHCC